MDTQDTPWIRLWKGCIDRSNNVKKHALLAICKQKFRFRDYIFIKNMVKQASVFDNFCHSHSRAVGNWLHHIFNLDTIQNSLDRLHYTAAAVYNGHTPIASGVVVKIVLPRWQKGVREREVRFWDAWCGQPRMFSHRKSLDFFRLRCKKLCVVGSKAGLSQFIYSFILRWVARIQLLGRQPKNVLIGSYCCE